jgi:hypothetical protein
MTDLTLENIHAFLLTNPSSGNCNDDKILNVSPSKITDIDNFLMKTNVSFQTYTSPTRKDNFLTLYNDQYVRNLEVVAGIFFISAVLGKMMFYPIVIG